jgi:2,3-bisphosphoglycerate-independent phosphoglycerate mutase
MPEARKFPMAEAIREAYTRGEEEEQMEPLVLVNADDTPLGRINGGDYVIFYNIRGEREVQLSESLIDPDFKHFPVEPPPKAKMATMIQYDRHLDRFGVKVAFPPLEEIKDSLSEVVSKNGLKQVKITESEKEVHISFFFNGKNKEPFPGEERITIPSPRVRRVDEKPEMSIAEVTRAIVEKINQGEHSLIVANFPNLDVIGHTENREAILKAVVAVDTHTGMVVEAARKAGVITLITSDHGTVESWLYPEGTIDTGHTKSPVHCLLIDPTLPPSSRVSLKEDGALTDAAPTVLALLAISKPEVMTGESLLANYPEFESAKRRVLLLITDGWGISDDDYGNLIKAANTPVMDSFYEQYPHTSLKASGEAVGLPEGTVGNSESGHSHMGCGRVIYADRMRIKKSIDDGSFFQNEAFLWAMQNAKKEKKPLHLLGIVSFYSSHGSVDYALALLEMAKREGLSEVYIHSMLGRRGERPETGAIYTEKIERECQRLGLGKVVSVIGRYYALDREENWDRVEKAYRLYVHGEGRKVREM